MSRLSDPIKLLTMMITLLVGLGAVGLMATPVAAQQNASQQSETAEQPPAGVPAEDENSVQPIEVTDIPDRSEELATHMREVEARWQQPAINEELAAGLDSMTRRIADQQLETAASLDSTSSSQQFDRQRQIWLALLKIMEEPDFELNEVDDQATTDLDSLTAVADLWTVTRDASNKDEIPESIRQRIDENLAILDTVKQRVLEQRSSVLTTKDSIVRLRGTCREMITAITDAQEKSREILLKTGIEPLWKALKNSPGWSATWSTLFESVRLKYSTVKTHIELHMVRVIVRLCLLALLAFFFIMLRRRARLFAAYDASFQNSVIALENPISAAVLVVILTVSFFDPPMRDVANILTLALIIPLLRLVPKLIPVQLTPGLYSFSMVFVLSWLADYFPAEALTSRMLLLLGTLISLVTLWWLRRRLKPMLADAKDRRPKLLSAYSSMGMVLLIVALYADVAGNPLLANVLVRGTLRTFFSAILLWSMIAVLRGVIAVVFRSQTMQHLRIVHLYGEQMRDNIFRVLVNVARVAWLYFTLVGFGIYQPVFNAVKDFLYTPLVLGSATIDIGGILLLIVVIWLSFVTSRFVRFILDKDVLPRLDLPRGVPDTISSLTNYTILFVGFLLAVSAAGLDLNRFTVVAGALGVGIGFGLQDMVNNFVSGLVLLFERPVSPGDRIQLGEMVCIVKKIGIRASTVRTFDGAEVIVPNGMLVSKEVTNWTLSDPNRRVKIPIGVAYGSDTSLVLNILADVAGKNELILKSPAPDIYFVGFGDSSLDFSLRIWVDQHHDWLAVRSDICGAIDQAFAEQGIVVPYPQRDLHLRSVDSGLGPVPTLKEGSPVPSTPAPAPPPPAAPQKSAEPPPSSADGLTDDDGDSSGDSGGDE